MYAHIDDIESIREILIDNQETLELYEDGFSLFVSFEPGENHCYYSLDETGEQTETSIERIFKIVGDRWEPIYMNTETGSVGTRDEWNYEDENDNTLNAVDQGEVVRVKWDYKAEAWIEYTS